MSHDLTLAPRRSAGWLTILFAALAALAVWTGLTHPRQAAAEAQAAVPPQASAPAADMGAVFVGVAPNASDTTEEPAPTF